MCMYEIWYFKTAIQIYIHDFTLYDKVTTKTNGILTSKYIIVGKTVAASRQLLLNYSYYWNTLYTLYIFLFTLLQEKTTLTGQLDWKVGSWVGRNLNLIQ